MLYEIFHTTVTLLLAVCNVYHSFKVLQANASEQTVRKELEFWGVYVLAFLLTEMLRADAPWLQLTTALGLVCLREFASDVAVLSTIFEASKTCVNFVDEHLITPNSEKLLVKPCTRLLRYTLDTVKKSKSLSNDDRKVAAESLRHSLADIRKEIVARDKLRFSEQAQSTDDDTAFDANSQRPQTPVKKTPLTLASLHRYFSQHGIGMTDSQIAQILKNYENRDDELREKLEAKYHHPVEEHHAAALRTPQSAQTSRPFASVDGDDTFARPQTDNVVLRRRKTTGTVN